MFSACVKKPVPLGAYHSAVPVFNGCLSLVVVAKKELLGKSRDDCKVSCESEPQDKSCLFESLT